MISQALVDEFEQQVFDPYHEMTYESFDGEVDFIRQTAIKLAGTQVTVGNESIQVDSKVTHGTPTARFSSRHAAGSCNRVCEISDLLFTLEVQVNGMVDYQRAMLVQAKFEPTNAGSDNQYWTVDMRQLELLHRLPVFEIVATVDYEPFDLDPTTKTFTSYSFASTFKLPFYQSADRVFSESNLANCDFSQKTSRFRSSDFIGFDSSPSVLKRFLQGTLGEDITDPDTEVRRLVESLYDYTANERSYHALFTDGGVPVNEHNKFDFAIITITVQRENDNLPEDEQRSQSPRHSLLR